MKNYYASTFAKYNNEEEWRWIPGYTGIYEVSNYGRVRSYKSSKQGVFIVPKITKAGYWFVHLSNGTSKNGPRLKTVGISRLVASLFLTNPEDLGEVDHIDNDKSNNHVSNLQWIIHDKNVRKDQGYTYKIWNLEDPATVYWFDSKRQASGALGKSHGWLTYHIKNQSFPTRDGWVCEVSKAKGSEKKRW